MLTYLWARLFLFALAQPSGDLRAAGSGMPGPMGSLCSRAERIRCMNRLDPSLIRDFDLFTSMSEDQLRAVLSDARPRQVPKGAALSSRAPGAGVSSYCSTDD